jgi:hypothetical protein
MTIAVQGGTASTTRALETPVAGGSPAWEPRSCEEGWWQTCQSREDLVARLLTLFTDADADLTRDKTRRRGLAKLLDWLQRQPGRTWQERWLVSGADAAGSGWTELPLKGRVPIRRHHRDELFAGLVLLVAGQVIRPGYRWLLSQRMTVMLAEARAAFDPGVFRGLELHAQHATAWARSDALNKITWMVIRKGGLVSSITVGDCLELTAALEEHHFRGSAGRPLFYALLKDTGVLPVSAPSRLRALRIEGRRSVAQIVDGYGIECGPVRDLLVEYFTERAPELDHTSLRSIARNLCRLFWRDLEIHHPGIDSLHLSPQVAQAWKERLAFIRDATGQPVRPRINYRSELVFVRAFYEDIARWAADDPARWAPWVAPCPVKAAECTQKKFKSRVKSRMDQRTRTQLPLLPALLRAVGQQRKDAEERIAAARDTPAGDVFTAAGQEFWRRRPGQAGRVNVTEVAAGKRRNLTHEEEAAFWSWATVEVLRHTGIRIEEMLELTHHSFIAYTLPTTGEVVPMLQVAPSKTDAERLLLVSPELAEVLTAIIFRVRAGNRALPLVCAYDVFEQTWSPPMPFLFQRRYGNEDRPIGRSYIRECMVATSQATQITAAGETLEWRPHDFRRIFVTDALRSGLPPHIAAKICTPCWTPPWATPRSTQKTSSPITGRSSPAAAPSGPAKNTAISPLPNGTSSSRTSSCGRSPWGPAAAISGPHVRMKMPVSDVPSSGSTRPRCPAWKRSTPTWVTGSTRPGSRVGSARSPRSRPPWRPPRRNLKPCAASLPDPPAFTSACLTSVPPPGDAVQARDVPPACSWQEEKPNTLNCQG